SRRRGRGGTAGAFGGTPGLVAPHRSRRPGGVSDGVKRGGGAAASTASSCGVLTTATIGDFFESDAASPRACHPPAVRRGTRPLLRRRSCRCRCCRRRRSSF
ncbi:unnamed protein product, partial [Ectocarpus sp. 12 AP-2014]